MCSHSLIEWLREDSFFALHHLYFCSSSNALLVTYFRIIDDSESHETCTSTVWRTQPVYPSGVDQGDPGRYGKYRRGRSMLAPTS